MKYEVRKGDQLVAVFFSLNEACEYCELKIGGSSELAKQWRVYIVDSQEPQEEYDPEHDPEFLRELECEFRTWRGY